MATKPNDGTTASTPQPGDDCGNADCAGHLVTVNTRIDREAQTRTRYLGCRTCGYRPSNNAIVVPLQFAPPRPKRNIEVSATSSTIPKLVASTCGGTRE